MPSFAILPHATHERPISASPISWTPGSAGKSGTPLISLCVTIAIHGNCPPRTPWRSPKNAISPASYHGNTLHIVGNTDNPRMLFELGGRQSISLGGEHIFEEILEIGVHWLIGEGIIYLLHMNKCTLIFFSMFGSMNGPCRYNS